MDILTGIWNTVVGAPGTVASVVSIIGLVGAVWLLLKKAINESVQAFTKVKSYLEKYKNILTTGQGADDFKSMVIEVDQALDAYADILAKLGMKGLAKKLRDLINQ